MLIAAFVVSAIRTVASLALRLLNADPTLTFGVAALTILALATSCATPPRTSASRPDRGSAGS